MAGSLTPTSVPEQVATEIRRKILSGELRPGQTFSLREISGQLRVIIPAWEVLRGLRSAGSGGDLSRKRAMVAPLSRDDQLIYRLRQQLEPEIAGHACKLLDDADSRRLENYVAMFGDESLDIDDIYQAHRAFHEWLQPATIAHLHVSGGTPQNHLDEEINEWLPFVLDLTDVRRPGSYRCRSDGARGVCGVAGLTALHGGL